MTNTKKNSPGRHAKFTDDFKAEAVRLVRTSGRPLRAISDDLGGSFSAVHGVGSKRIHSLYQTADAVKLKLMEEVKHLLDPQNLMNPNKVPR